MRSGYSTRRKHRNESRKPDREAFALAVSATPISAQAEKGAPITIRDKENVWARTMEGVALIEAVTLARTNISEEERIQMPGLLDAARNQEGDARRNGMLIVTGRTIGADEHPVEIEIASLFGGTVPLTGTMIAGITARDIASVEIAGSAAKQDGSAVRETVRYRGHP